MAIEDFGTYTEVDPNSKITVTTRRASCADLQRQDKSYVYKDRGVSFFDGDFSHHLTIFVTSGVAGSGVGFWSVANELGTYGDIKDNSGDGLFVIYSHPLLIAYELDGGTHYNPTSYTLSPSTSYYLKVVRDESVGTYGTFYCYIYSDFAKTTLLATLSVTLHTSRKDYRYIYAMQAFFLSGSGNAVSGYTENLALFGTSDGGVLPVVTAQAPTDITDTTATGHGTIVDLGISAVTEHGYCWSTSINPTTANSKTTEGAGSLGVFTSSITGLLAGQEYWIRPYATNGAGTGYGANIGFIAGQPGTLRVKGEFAVVLKEFHYVDEDGKERGAELPLV